MNGNIFCFLFTSILLLSFVHQISTIHYFLCFSSDVSWYFKTTCSYWWILIEILATTNVFWLIVKNAIITRLLPDRHSLHSRHKWLKGPIMFMSSCRFIIQFMLVCGANLWCSEKKTNYSVLSICCWKLI